MLLGTRRLVNLKAALVLAAGVALICPTPALPQANSATLYGSVTDPAGAVVPTALISLIAQDTGISLKKTTDDSGEFAFTFVPVGTYTLRIEAKGFRVVFRDGSNSRGRAAGTPDLHTRTGIH